jgi:hypothetical protein
MWLTFAVFLFSSGFQFELDEKVVEGTTVLTVKRSSGSIFLDSGEGAYSKKDLPAKGEVKKRLAGGIIVGFTSQRWDPSCHINPGCSRDIE